MTRRDDALAFLLSLIIWLTAPLWIVLGIALARVYYPNEDPDHVA